MTMIKKSQGLIIQGIFLYIKMREYLLTITLSTGQRKNNVQELLYRIILCFGNLL